MARQYVITDFEAHALIDKLKLHNLQANNISHPFKVLDDSGSEGWRHLTDREKAAVRVAIDSIHGGFHMVAIQWLQDMGVKLDVSRLG